jgi:hypothetical protein
MNYKNFKNKYNAYRLKTNRGTLFKVAFREI